MLQAADSRLQRGRARRRRRGAVVLGVTATLALGLFVVTMMVGSYRLSAGEVIVSMLRLRDDPSVDFIVRELRLPLALTGLGVGIAMGMSGTIFQRLLNNPLASPDFIGVSYGASLFAVMAIVLWPIPTIGVGGVALVGALVTAFAIYLLAWRDGITGYRFILIGIGISELLVSLIAYIVARADIFDARQAMTWLVGSIGHASDGILRMLLITLVVVLPLIVMMERQLRILELGSDTARALGARAEAGRLTLIAVAVILIAVATSAAGPLAFVSLIAGPIALRMLGPSGGGLLVSGFVGASIVLGADLVSQHLLPVTLPTGVLTGAIGAPYLIWLLATANREGRGG